MGQFEFGNKPGNLLPPGVSAFNRLFRDYKIKAKKRNLPFELSKEYFEKITKYNCYYCGKEPSQVRYTHVHHGVYSIPYTYNGIDRIDSSKGYTEDNVVPCCGRCNEGKMSQTKEDFLYWIKRVYEHSLTNTKECATIE